MGITATTRSRIGSDRIGSDRIGSDRIGSDRIGSDRLDRNSSVQVRFRPDSFLQRPSWRFALVPFAMALASLTSAGVAAQEVVPEVPPAATVAPAAATAPADFSISAGSLADALHQFSEQSGIQVFFESELVNGKAAPGIEGSLPVQDALNALLSGSGLVHQFVNDKTLILRRSPDAAMEGEGAAVAGAVTPLAAEALTAADDITTESVTSIRRGGIEEVIITARRREESVQNVPIAITALTSEDMKAFGIKNIGDMEGIVPGLNMGGGGNGLKKDSNPFIRGVGQRETKVTLDPGVGTYLDGIYLARTGGALLDTVGVERVEVLRGPQGTLFGRNAVGGSISVTTIKPNADWGGSITANVGNFGRSDVVAMANIPLIGDTLLSRITVASTNSDGYFTNVVDNSKWGDDNRITGIGQFRWLAADNLSFDLLTERTRVRETPRPSKCAIARPFDDSGSYTTNPNYFAPTPIRSTNIVRTNFLNPDNRKTYHQMCADSEGLPNDQFSSDFSGGDDLLQKGRYWIDTATAGLTAIWDVGALGPLSDTQFKSISAWRKVEQIADEDLDATESAQLLRIQDGFNESWQATQELQFNGSALDDRLFFSTGLYYFKEETPQDTLIRTAGIVQGNPHIQIHPFTGVIDPNHPNTGRIQMQALEPTRETLETDNEAYAWYGQIDYKITPQIELTTGLRYTREERWSAYSKAYTYALSMVTGEVFGSGTGTPGAQTTIYTQSPGLANIFDWRFYDIGSPGGRRKEASTSDDAWTPMVSLKYHAEGAWLEAMSINDAMAYVTFSKGFGAGGVTSGAVDTDPRPPGSILNIETPLIFKPQHIENYEVGLKMQALDRRVQANVAIFYTNYTDMQVTSTANRAGVPVAFIDNVGKAVIQGVEAEFVVFPVADWRVMLNAAYTDADLKEWEARNVLLSPFTGQPTNAYTITSRDDEPMPRVPEWQAFFLTDYTIRLPGGSILTPSVAARYSSEIYHGFDRGSWIYGRDVVTSDEVIFVDARATWISADGKTEIAAWGKNLTDKQDYLVGAIPLVDTTGTVGQIFANPRTFGLTMTYNFGAQ